MDDDDVQDTSIVTESGMATPTKTPTKTAPAAKPTVAETQAPANQATVTDDPEEAEVVPPKPPRPMSEAQKNEVILKEAFPSVDPGVIKAILRASGGKVEPAFNALLGM